MLRCKHCGQVSRSEEAYNDHQKICKKNPKINGLSPEEKQLLNHYRYLYPDVYTHLYTETSNKYLMTEREAKGYSYALAHAKRDVLEKLIALDEPKQIANNVWSCPICNLHIKDMGAHVIKVHNKPWDEFVSEYSWDSPKIFYDDDHRKNLHKNKIHYYNETDAGAQRKKLQSENFSGNNNPACRDEVKLKISESRKGQHMSIKNKENISKSTTSALYSKNAKSYGYTFWSYVDGKEMRFRSKCEYIVYLMFNYYGFSVEYEPYKIEYEVRINKGAKDTNILNQAEVTYNGETVKGWQLVYMRISKHKARMFKNGIVIPTDIIEN